MAATRFHFQTAESAPISPGFDAAWDITDAALRLALYVEKQATGAVLAASNAVTPPENILHFQYVSAPLAAQTISGFVKGQVLCTEEDGSMNCCSQCVIRILSGDGSVVRGTLLAAQSTTLSSEWNVTSIRSRKMPLAALSPAALVGVSAQAGDRLVIEVGAAHLGAVAGDASMRMMDNSASDLSENETSGATADPWMEFSAAIAFQAAGTILPVDDLWPGFGLAGLRLRGI